MTRSKLTFGSAFKETDKGQTLLLFTRWDIKALRPQPARAWRYSTFEERWRGTRDIDLNLAEELRRVRKHQQGDGLESASRRTQNVARFFAHVDDELCETIAAWPTFDWELFQSLENIPALKELFFGGHQTLAWMLSQVRTLRPGWMKNANRAVRNQLASLHRGKKLADICRYLGLPPTKATVRQLKRLTPDALKPGVARALVTTLNHEPGRKRLAHLEAPTARTIEALGPETEPVVGQGLVEFFQGQSHLTAGTFGPVSILRDTVRLWRDLRTEVIPRQHTLESVELLHNRLVAEMRAKKCAVDTRTIPVPLILHDESVGPVRPLTTVAALWNEGHAMNHCLGMPSHVSWALEGRYFAWAIEGPERLTFAIAKNDHGRWTFSDLRGPSNVLPSDRACEWAAGVVRRANGQKPVPGEYLKLVDDGYDDDGGDGPGAGFYDEDLPF